LEKMFNEKTESETECPMKKMTKLFPPLPKATLPEEKKNDTKRRH